MVDELGQSATGALGQRGSGAAGQRGSGAAGQRLLKVSAHRANRSRTKEKYALLYARMLVCSIGSMEFKFRFFRSMEF